MRLCQGKRFEQTWTGDRLWRCKHRVVCSCTSRKEWLTCLALSRPYLLAALGYCDLDHLKSHPLKFTICLSWLVNHLPVLLLFGSFPVCSGDLWIHYRQASDMSRNLNSNLSLPTTYWASKLSLPGGRSNWTLATGISISGRGKGRR